MSFRCSVLTGLHCMSVSQRILRNWVIQNWFYNYRRISWKKTESRKKAESAGDNWRYPYYTVEPLYNSHLGRTEESGHFREVVVVERLKQEWMYGLSAKKNGRCREVAVSVEGSTAVDVRKEVPYTKTKNHFVFPYSLMWGLNYVVFY